MSQGRPGGNPDLVKRNGPGHGRTKGSKNKLTRERVEQELRVVALTNSARLMFGNGKRKFTMREIAEMPEELQRCIASVKVKTENLTAGDDAQDTTVEIRLWPKVQALELCARSLGMLKDTVVHEFSETQLSMLDDWKRRNRKVDSE
jgi:hypothetical protein